jgi:hypothetical protein
MFVILGADGRHKRVIVNLSNINYIESDSFIGKKSGTVFFTDGTSRAISDTQMKTLMDSVHDLTYVPVVDEPFEVNYGDDFPTAHQVPKVAYGEKKYLPPKWITFHADNDPVTRVPRIDVMFWDIKPIGVPCYELHIPIPEEVLKVKTEVLEGFTKGPFDHSD